MALSGLFHDAVNVDRLHDLVQKMLEGIIGQVSHRRFKHEAVFNGVEIKIIVYGNGLPEGFIGGAVSGDVGGLQHFAHGRVAQDAVVKLGDMHVQTGCLIGTV